MAAAYRNRVLCLLDGDSRLKRSIRTILDQQSLEAETLEELEWHIFHSPSSSSASCDPAFSRQNVQTVVQRELESVYGRYRARLHLQFHESSDDGILACRMILTGAFKS
jgi:hypothetical protein